METFGRAHGLTFFVAEAPAAISLAEASLLGVSLTFIAPVLNRGYSPLAGSVGGLCSLAEAEFSLRLAAWSIVQMSMEEEVASCEVV